MNRKAAKAFVYLMAAMLFLTVVSRAADAFFVPQVTVEEPSAKVIEHTVEMDGVVEKSSESPVFTEAGILIESVCIEAGSRVEEGDVLARVLPDDLAEQIGVLSDEITALQLANDALAANEAAAAAAQTRDAARAKEDYDRTVQKQSNAVELAKESMDAAEQAIREMEAQEAAGTLAGMSEEEKQQKADALWEEYFAKKAAYDAAVLDAQAAEDAAERVVEDAEKQTNVDNTQEINALTIAQKEAQLKKLLALQENDGEITAPVAGTVTDVFVSVGERTPDTAAFVVAQIGETVCLTAQITKEEAEYVRAGDTAVVEKQASEYEGFTVSAVRQNEDGSFAVSLTCEENTGEFAIGDAVSVSVTEQSKRYSDAVPTEALHIEQDGTYVYVLDERDSVLGTELFARKVQVDVLEKNSRYAAVEEGRIGAGDQVIVDSDRYVEEGSRVRLAEQ